MKIEIVKLFFNFISYPAKLFFNKNRISYRLGRVVKTDM